MLPAGIATHEELTQLINRILNGEVWSEDVHRIEYGQSRSWVIEVEIAARKANLLKGPDSLVRYFPTHREPQLPSEISQRKPTTTKYGDLTGEQKRAMREELAERQQYRCCICRKHFSEKNKPNLDHCHETGRIRGLLCNHCNLGLGGFQDSIMNMDNAIKYLLEHATIRLHGNA